MSDWYEQLAANAFPGDSFRLRTGKKRVGFEHPHVREYYRTKYEVARILAPVRILEIGVRAGYSAFAFLSAAPAAEFVGFDSQDPRYGDAAALAFWARKLIPEGPNRFLCKVDSQAQTGRVPIEVGDSPWIPDLVHVDGDHSKAGAAHDIALAFALGAQWVLLDDWDYPCVPGVREAGQEARAKFGSVDFLDPLRGSLLLFDVGKPLDLVILNALDTLSVELLKWH